MTTPTTHRRAALHPVAGAVARQAAGAGILSAPFRDSMCWRSNPGGPFGHTTCALRGGLHTLDALPEDAHRAALGSAATPT